VEFHDQDREEAPSQFRSEADKLNQPLESEQGQDGEKIAT
jgi:hypothetical protein